MGVEKLLGRLLGVRGMRVRGAHLERGDLVVDVLPPRGKSRCGVCGRPSPRYDSCPPRLWRHLALGRTRIWLRYAPRRVQCPVHGVRVEQVPWAAHDSHFTREFEEMVAWLAQRMDKSATCRLMAINWRTVGTIVKRVVAQRLDASRLEELYIIGVDELSHRSHHQYLSVVVDHLKSRVVWMGEGKREETLHGFFDELGEERTRALTHVTTDLSAPFIKAVKQRAPQACQVFDRFHVRKLANEAVDEVRRSEVRQVAGTEAAAAVKKSRWALLKNPWNLDLRQGEKPREVQRFNQRLYRAYLLKESLARGMDYRQPASASAHLDEWSQWASRSKLKPFVRLAKTIRRHKQA
jgi:transposase